MILNNLFLFLFLTLGTIISEASQKNPVVRITNGLIKGRKAFTVGIGQPYSAFQGIPYAEPPIDNLRFMPPIPKINWHNTLDATKDGSICVQGNNPVNGSEDCLFINVYTPKLPTFHSKLLPTMVFIHPGGFEGGSSTYDLYGPDYLLEKEVVVVTFNYRLGLFGFLSTGDMVVPGNNGLKDQLLALTWVQDNIAAFGGDHQQVTLFGQSAGAVSISYHLQSPLSEGLFQRVIMESGVSLCLWGLSRRIPEVASAIGKELSISTKTSKSLADGLRAANYTKLQAASAKAITQHYKTQNPLNGFVYGPVIEPVHDKAFVTGKSHELLKNGKFTKVPCIVGFNSLEGTFQFSSLFRVYLIQYDLLPARLVPVDMNVSSVTERIQIGFKIKDHYFGFIPLFTSNRKLMQFLSDDQFVRPVREFVRQVSKRVPTYFYRFSYEGGLWGITNRTVSGVTHSEELGYIWRSKYEPSPKDLATRRRMITMWTNFAKTGNPTPTKESVLQDVAWSKSDEDFTYLDIGDDLVLKKNPEDKHMKFWDGLYEKHGSPPFDTY